MQDQTFEMGPDINISHKTHTTTLIVDSLFLNINLEINIKPNISS